MKTESHPLQPMSKQSTAWMGVGCVLMAWGGGTIGRSLTLSPWTQLAVPVFAMGILLAVLAPLRSLAVRVQALEAELSAARAREQVREAKEQLRGS